MVNEELIFRRGSGKNHGNHCTDRMQNFRTIDLALADADSKESVSFMTPPGLGIDNVLSPLNILSGNPSKTTAVMSET